MFARLMEDYEKSEKKAKTCRDDTIAELKRHIMKDGINMEYSTKSECPQVLKELGFSVRREDWWRKNRVSFSSSSKSTLGYIKEAKSSWIPSDMKEHFEFLGAKVDNCDMGYCKVYRPEK